ALICGALAAVTVSREIVTHRPGLRPLLTTMTTLLTVFTVGAVIAAHRTPPPMTDVRPEISRVIATELRTASSYDQAVDRFRKGRITAPALAEVIEKTIVPELRNMAARLRALQHVPAQNQPSVTTAEEFLKIRDESWQLRAAALHKGDM